MEQVYYRDGELETGYNEVFGLDSDNRVVLRSNLSLMAKEIGRYLLGDKFLVVGRPVGFSERGEVLLADAEVVVGCTIDGEGTVTPKKFCNDATGEEIALQLMNGELYPEIRFPSRFAAAS